MSGYVGDLSTKQALALSEFKHNVADLLKPEHDDYYCLRWLRAREFNVSKSEHMLREHHQWRKQYGLDTILNNYESPEVMRKYYPGGIIGHDKDGCPIWIVPFGDADIKGMVQSVRKVDIMKHIIQEFEFCEEDMRKQTEKLGRVIETQTYIFDFENFSLRQMTSKAVIDVVTDLISIYESNYPERLKVAFVINAPKFFPLFWKIIRPFLSDKTANKVKIYGRDGWKKDLEDVMELTEIPVHWGGTKLGPDGDPRCSHIVIPGGEVPTSYYKCNAKRLSSEDNAVVTFIDRQGTVEIPVDVEEAGSTLTWEFQTCDHDVGFGLTFKPHENCNEDEIDEMVKMTRVNCHLVPETGTLTCAQSGTYIFKFDNTFSWFTGKKIAYRMQVMPPSTSL